MRRERSGGGPARGAVVDMRWSRHGCGVTGSEILERTAEHVPWVMWCEVWHRLRRNERLYMLSLRAGERDVVSPTPLTGATPERASRICYTNMLINTRTIT